MKQSVEVREHARLTTAPVASNLSQASIPRSAFDWLRNEMSRSRTGAAPLVQIEGREWLRLDNYVGVIETPCGTRIEILPKHADDHAGIVQLRELLVRMVTRAFDLPTRDMGPASLRLFDCSPSEWLMRRFLDLLDRLVKRGVRFEYERLEEGSRFLRGQLDIGRQLRQPPERQHIFQIRHDVFSPDTPENRLLKTAVERVRQATRRSDNWRLAHELSVILEVIPSSRNTERDFRHWRRDRLMAHYDDVRRWCELLLRHEMPLTQAGEWEGISLLFPMEKLYERYVATCLERRLAPRARLTRQAGSERLCRHLGQEWFLLSPDMLLTADDLRFVLDTKWKRIDSALANGRDKYGLSQTDFYQLYAYGQRYLRGRGELYLIYPRTKSFSKPLPPFEFSDSMRLWVVPFDLEAESLIEGEWTASATWWSGWSPRKTIEADERPPQPSPASA